MQADACYCILAQTTVVLTEAECYKNNEPQKKKKRNKSQA